MKTMKWILFFGLLLSPIIGFAQSEQLIQAIQANDTVRIQRLLDQGVNVNLEDSKGRIPLIYATGNRDAKIVQLLLAKGANVNAKMSTAILP